MSRLLRALAGLGLALVLVTAVSLVRTLRYVPPPMATVEVAKLSPAPSFDLDAAARRLGAAVRFRTVSHQNPADDEPAEWDRLHAWLVASYPAAHRAMQRELVDGRTLIYTWTGREPALQPVILMAHQDVVPVESGTAAAWRQPPFSGELADGAVWGRGTVDDKGSLVALFEALEALAQNGYAPRRTLILVSGANEEVLGSGAEAAAAALASRGVHGEFVLDEGLLILARHPVTHAPAAMIGIAEKGYATLEVTARSAGGHSSMPPPDTAVATLAESLLAIIRHPGPTRLTGPTQAMLETLAPAAAFGTRFAIANQWLFEPLLVAKLGATPSGAAMLHTTIAPTMLAGSAKDNVLADRASAWINYRILPGESSAQVLAAAKAAVGPRPVEFHFSRAPVEPSPVSSVTSRGWGLLAGLAAEAAGGPAAPGLMIGGTDARRLQAVATDVYRFQPITLATDELSMLHGVNEHMTLANLAQSIRFYARFARAATE